MVNFHQGLRYRLGLDWTVAATPAKQALGWGRGRPSPFWDTAPGGSWCDASQPADFITLDGPDPFEPTAFRPHLDPFWFHKGVPPHRMGVW